MDIILLMTGFRLNCDSSNALIMLREKNSNLAAFISSLCVAAVRITWIGCWSLIAFQARNNRDGQFNGQRPWKEWGTFVFCFEGLERLLFIDYWNLSYGNVLLKNNNFFLLPACFKITKHTVLEPF